MPNPPSRYRKAILDHLRANPDASMDQIAVAVGTSKTNVAWHLKKLVLSGQLVRLSKWEVIDPDNRP